MTNCISLTDFAAYAFSVQPICDCQQWLVSMFVCKQLHTTVAHVFCIMQMDSEFPLVICLITPLHRDELECVSDFQVSLC